MRMNGAMRGLMLVAALAMAGHPALAQQAQIIADRGLTEDLPYTAFYPNVLQSIDDGSDATILTLQHPAAPLRCDIFAVASDETGWSAENAVANLDTAGIVATWGPDFPGFEIVAQQVVDFASGPALFYEATSADSPLGVPLRIIHAETIDNGRIYAVECLIGRAVEADARPLVDFVVANFSTRSDGECCIDPSAGPG